MSKQITSMTQLRDGQKIVALKPTTFGTVKIEYLQAQKGNLGAITYVQVPKPATPRPDITRRWTMVTNKGGERYLTHQWAIDGLLVSNGPCRNRDCSLGLVRQKASGEHLACKQCWGGWL